MANRTNKIPYPQDIFNFQVETSAAKTTENDTANAVLAYTVASTAPAILTKLQTMPKVTVTASRLKIYIAKSATPTVLHLVKNKLMPATTVNETTEPAPVDWGYADATPLKLQSGDALYVASGTAISCTWHGEGEIYLAA